MDINSTKYIVISPVRNEEQNIEHTIKSVTSQTIKPLKWIIVDDGSSDNTPNIVEQYAKDNNWISLIRLPDRGYYDLNSGGEIKAFYRGYERIKDEDYNFLAKLDGDISFDEHYFENLLKEFQLNRKLGIASGLCYIQKDNRLIPEKTYKKHPRGPARMYRRECWDDMDGVKDVLTWDAIDVYKARMLGWDTFNFESYKAIHHVKTWEKGGIIHGLIRAGRLQYLMGTHPIFFTAKLIRLIFSKPYILGTCLIAYGYVKSYILREERVPEPELLNYIQKDQLRRLRLHR